MTPPAIHSATAGIHRNLAMFEAAVHRIATRPVDVNTIGDVVDLKRAQFGVKINVAVLRTANEMSGQLVDIFA